MTNVGGLEGLSRELREISRDESSYCFVIEKQEFIQFFVQQRSQCLSCNMSVNLWPE